MITVRSYRLITESLESWRTVGSIHFLTVVINGELSRLELARAGHHVCGSTFHRLMCYLDPYPNHHKVNYVELLSRTTRNVYLDPPDNVE